MPSHLPADTELVTAINRGDEAAFRLLYQRYRDWVVRLAMRFTHHEADALDVLQETFQYVLRKGPTLTLSASMTTFLYPVVKNLALAARRKRTRFINPLEEIPFEPVAPIEEVGGESSRVQLSALLASLPTIQSEVILMRFVDGMSLEEIADALGVALGTVKSRLHNGLTALREDPRTRRYFSGE